jgi:predicted HTH transcriptional regulator
MNKELDKFLNRNIDEVLEWTNIITTMIDDSESFRYAEETLRGILEHIEQTGAVSSAQIRAIENIRSKPTRKYGRYLQRRRY